MAAFDHGMTELLGPYLSEQVQTNALDLFNGQIVCDAAFLDPGLPGIREFAK